MAVKDDLINAGALYDGDARVVVDGNQSVTQTYIYFLVLHLVCISAC